MERETQTAEAAEAAPADQDDPSEAPESADDNPMERHRPLVREMSRSFQTLYGYGGAVVIVAAVGAILVGWALGALGSAVTWLAGLVVALVGMFILGIVVRRRADTMRQRIERYGETNDVSIEELREYYRRDGNYPFFEAIFEKLERREELRERLQQSDDDADA